MQAWCLQLRKFFLLRKGELRIGSRPNSLLDIRATPLLRRLGEKGQGVVGSNLFARVFTIVAV